jgi:hypothetical protein
VDKIVNTVIWKNPTGGYTSIYFQVHGWIRNVCTFVGGINIQNSRIQPFHGNFTYNEISLWQVILNLECITVAGHRQTWPSGLYSSTAFPDDQSGKAQIALASKGAELDQKENKEAY